MSDRKATVASASQELAKKLCAASAKPICQRVCFANDEVPKYLGNLRQFEEDSAKVRILVK